MARQDCLAAKRPREWINIDPAATIPSLWVTCSKTVATKSGISWDLVGLPLSGSFEIISRSDEQP
jgi:hypothetical protein